MYINICCIYNVFQPRHGLGLTVTIDSQAVRSSRLIWGFDQARAVGTCWAILLKVAAKMATSGFGDSPWPETEDRKCWFQYFPKPWFTVIHHDSPWFGDSLYFQWNSSEHMVRARQGSLSHNWRLAEMWESSVRPFTRTAPEIRTS